MITEESFVDFKCPYCAGENSFPQSSEGTLVECVNCQESLMVPEAGNDTGRALRFPRTTPRLCLRRFAAEDWKALTRLAADDTFLDHTPHLAIEGDDEAVREAAVLRWLENESQVRLTTPDTVFCLAVEVAADSALAGLLRMHFTDSARRQANFSLNLHPDYQRRGFGFEAASSFLEFCFKELRLHRVTASCDGQNAAACRLLEKLGMRREGEFVKDHSYDGVWRNTVWYALLAEECCEPAPPRQGK